MRVSPNYILSVSSFNSIPSLWFPRIGLRICVCLLSPHLVITRSKLIVLSVYSRTEIRASYIPAFWAYDGAASYDITIGQLRFYFQIGTLEE